ncbi:MAG: hypothetical protein LBS53_05165, partial [Synergistaceae bacterium]|nr:hypothetical protein [Synergistaceae bacterium]
MKSKSDWAYQDKIKITELTAPFPNEQLQEASEAARPEDVFVFEDGKWWVKAGGKLTETYPL